MEIVIKIDENVFTRLFDNGIEDYAIMNDDLFVIAKSIRNGIPLPEHHGRLIDADKLNIYDVSPADGFVVMGVTEEDIDLAPTIIEGSDDE